MKKLFRLLSILALASTVAFVSCKGDKGDTGPQGVAGQDGADGADGADGQDGADGEDGNANVKSAEFTVSAGSWSDLEVGGIGNGATSTWGTASVTSDIITANKFIQVFLVSGERSRPLPINDSKGNGESEHLEFMSKSGQVDLLYKWVSINGDVYKPSGDIMVKVVAIEESEAAAMRAAGVDMNNYNEMVNYMNRNISVPSVK
ncbi:hypothetical protein LAG90_14070 [Marinilongibacter aquaticus]|uniref:hypothetical protein n=1 Tax=Marinilongibacter aquaticus TaxID=2975157 RepID=UPI0021BD1D3E|nr:hypothetical protein [Marinilongibacter aquaticus]UBM57931.1 hypothetical protein LAG90_14070 [Marinilongibacter aquaticus]